MRTKYSCPHCQELFSRRWNKERHLKSVHSREGQGLSDIIFYDRPNIRNFKPSHLLQTEKTEISFIDLIMLYGFQYQATELAHAPQQRTLLALKNAESALRQIYSNCILTPKTSITGISGFVCRDCVKFEAIYIKDLGFDRTAQNRHICNHFDLEIVAKEPESYKSILPSVEMEAVENLFSMTKSWLSGPTFLNSHELLPIEDISPEICVLDRPSDDWLWRYSREKRIQMDDNDLMKFLALAKSTYAVVNFPNAVRYFTFISR